ncbi:coronin-7-like [Acanthaster planci]|uniref:Coronin n=1 Tax=Acanthaster planci TaxID=133434 RepID=A0A8B7ZAM8_ACAPL|nr:coronin-7-like [Acanthaster planci]
MSRFQTSKFKNASANVAKKEHWFSDLRTGSPSSCGNHIKASCTLMAFNTSNTGGGTLGIIPLDKCGRGLSSLPMLHAHGSLVTDMDFSPFDDYMLATCSNDNTIKLWDIPEGGLTESLSTPVVTIPKLAKVVQNVLFHPTAEGLLASSCDKTVQIWDIGKAQECVAMEVHQEQIQGISWKQDGVVMATTAKDKKLRILDPRQNTVCSETDGHSNNKDSRVCWLGSTDLILSTGFDRGRCREMCVWDQRQFTSSVCSHSVDQSTGTLMPLYDPDTNMLFAVGSGDTTLRYYEVTLSSPYITDRSTQSLPEQTKGIAMVPKRALDVMSCEVARLLLLTATAVVPIPYVVPRKSHRDFYGELFPDTNGDEAALSAADWLAGSDKQVVKVSLDPAKCKPVKKKDKEGLPSATASKPKLEPKPAVNNPPSVETTQQPKQPSTKPSPASSEGASEVTGKLAASSLQTQRPSQPQASTRGEGDNTANDVLQAAKPKFTAPTVSKFRHMNSALMPRSTHMFNLHNLSNSVCGECDVFHVNLKWGAVPLGGPGGLIGFVDLNKPGKLDRDLPSIQNGNNIMDFAWDPFDDSRLVVGCENAKILVWDVPSEGWTETLTEPSLILRGHCEKIYFIKFHPQAKDLLMSASYDMMVKIWDLSSGEEKISLTGHTDQIFSGAWSSDGSKIATVCKDGKIRIYNPRKSNEPINEGNGPPGSRGARILWVCRDDFLLVSGFERKGERTIYLYSVSDLSEALETISLNVAPATLVPYYDEDTNVVILTGKGDISALAYEILTEPPYFYDVAPFQQLVPHQGLSFFPKKVCNVRDVEFAKAMRLTQTTIEPVTFMVPRVKKEYFQDDIFPDTRVTWESVLTSQEWLDGKNGVQRRISLCPPDMKLLSSIPKVAPAPKKYVAEVELSYKTDEQKKEELLSAMTNKLQAKDEPLPQDLCEGVDEDEWSD